jgi:hypothetical protein
MTLGPRPLEDAPNSTAGQGAIPLAAHLAPSGPGAGA